MLRVTARVRVKVGVRARVWVGLGRPAAARGARALPRVAQLEHGRYGGRAVGEGGVGGAQLLDVAAQPEAHLDTEGR